jgi:uncharacterized DUF497 family protein
MDVKWNPAKARANWKKHGVSFPDAEVVLRDPHALTREDPDAKDEQRFVTLGLDSMGRVLVVVYAYKGDDIRLISARKASFGERRHYEK